METQEIIFFSLCTLIYVSVGVALGWSKGRRGDGAVLGLILGPVGWYMVSVAPDLRCPECRRVAEEGARRCQHCGCQLAGVR
jgi:hypothetical protein